MTKRKIVFFVVLLVFSVVCGLFSNEQASAWWKEKESDGKKTQCFAIQYKYVNKTKNEGKAAQDGNVDSIRKTAQLSSTYRVCAKVDDNGKVTSKLYFYDPPETKTKIALSDEKLKFTINTDGDTLIVSSCPGSNHLCEIGNLEPKKQEFNVSDYGTFKALGEAVWRFAPDKRSNQTKVEFDKNDSKESVEQEAEAMDENGGKDDDSGSSSIKETCANQGGAQSLGWIVCPIMELLGRASGNIYSDYVEPSLTVDPKLFSDENQSVKTGWQTFRDIANILFVILLLIVIFSQLTGVGIDNYGIKKILPKLIVVAVLINLSFIICVLAVDISNILGNSFQALFNGLSETLPAAENITVDGEKFIDGSSVEGVLASVGILLAAVTAIGKMWKNPAIVVSMLISAVGVFISIVFLFIMLAVREAAVVVLIVISPVAMVCYMLPNAKKYFDRWFKGFQGLLLVYPICGLMVGGGNYVAKLLMSAGFSQGGFISAFTAMIVGIVPIFFVPMVLKNSFSALGNIGGMISNIGRGVSRGTTRKMRDSRGFKNIQEMGYNRQRRIDAGLDKNGNLNARGERRAAWAKSRVGRFLGADTRMARDVEAAKKNIGEQEVAGAMLTGALATNKIPDAAAIGGLDGFGQGTENAYYAGNYLEASRNGNITEMNSALQAMKNSGMKSKDIARVLRYAENTAGYNNFSDENVAASYRRQIASQYNDILSTDAELKHFMKTGGTANGGVLGNYGDLYNAVDANGRRVMDSNDANPADITSLSGDSLAAAASSGYLTQGLAQRVRAENPNLSDDKMIMLGAAADGGVVHGCDYERLKNDAQQLAQGATVITNTMTVEAINKSGEYMSPSPKKVEVVNGNAPASTTQTIQLQINGGNAAPGGAAPGGAAPGSAAPGGAAPNHGTNAPNTITIPHDKNNVQVNIDSGGGADFVSE